MVVVYNMLVHCSMIPEVPLNENKLCMSYLLAGTLDYFVRVQSARTAVGHDKEGRIIVVQVGGKTGLSG